MEEADDHGDDGTIGAGDQHHLSRGSSNSLCDSMARRRSIFQAVLRPAYLSKKLTPPIPTKDGGTLRTILEAYEYMAAIGKERELRPHWHQVRELMLQEAEVAAVSSQVRLAVLKDAKLDVSALSKPPT